MAPHPSICRGMCHSDVCVSCAHRTPTILTANIKACRAIISFCPNGNQRKPSIYKILVYSNSVCVCACARCAWTWFFVRSFHYFIILSSMAFFRRLHDESACLRFFDGVLSASATWNECNNKVACRPAYPRMHSSHLFSIFISFVCVLRFYHFDFLSIRFVSTCRSPYGPLYNFTWIPWARVDRCIFEHMIQMRHSVDSSREAGILFYSSR